MTHGLIDEQADAFGEAVGDCFGDELQDLGHEFRIGLVGPVGFGLAVFADTQQETSVARPRPVFRAGCPSPSGGGCARLASLTFAPPPPEGGGMDGEKKNNLQH